MANILTAAEAATVLRTDASDQALVQLLPQVDAYLRNATGRDWSSDSTIHPMAQAAAQMLLVMWYENPGMLGQGITPLSFGLTAALVQLEAIALQYKPFAGRNGAGPIALPGARIGDSVKSLTGLVGSAGDQSVLFESVITIDNMIQQSSASDLSAKWFRAQIVSPGDL